MAKKSNKVKRYLLIALITAGITMISLISLASYINNVNTVLYVTVPEIKSNLVIPFVQDVPATSETFYAPVLMYHHISSTIAKNPYNVTPKVFAEQMAWLHDNGYNVISYAKFYHALATKTILPKRPVIITFDDGWTDQYENAFPVLKKYGFSEIFFIPSNYIGKRSGSMNFEMIKELVKNNMEIGSHTLTHAILTKVPKKQLISELTQSKKQLEENFGIPVDFFAYPGGDKNDSVIKAVKDAGYLSAVTVVHAVNHSYKENPFRVSRIHIDSDMSSFVDYINGRRL